MIMILNVKAKELLNKLDETPLENLMANYLEADNAMADEMDLSTFVKEAALVQNHLAHTLKLIIRGLASKAKMDPKDVQYIIMDNDAGMATLLKRAKTALTAEELRQLVMLLEAVTTITTEIQPDQDDIAPIKFVNWSDPEQNPADVEEFRL